eukprot:m.121711 g.121711  ORF g.121711 m.121711 type:complete len:70 (+) comp28871_c0_seq7:106-315(+)
MEFPGRDGVLEPVYVHSRQAVYDLNATEAALYFFYHAMNNCWAIGTVPGGNAVVGFCETSLRIMVWWWW